MTDAVHGAQIDVLQLERGRLRGYLTHMIVGGMPLSVGAFSIGVRTRGVLSDDRVTIGMLTGRTDRVTHWSHEMQPADVLVIPPGDAHDGRYQIDATHAVEGRGVAVALVPVEGDVSTGACGRTDLQAAVDEVGNDAGAGFAGRTEHECEEVSLVHDLYSEILS